MKIKKAFTIMEITISIAVVIVISALIAPKMIELYKIKKATVGVQQISWFIQNAVRNPIVGLNTNHHLPCLIKDSIDNGNISEVQSLNRLVADPKSTTLLFSDYMTVDPDSNPICDNSKKYWVPYELRDIVRINVDFLERPSIGITGLNKDKYVVEVYLLPGDSLQFRDRIESMLLSNLFAENTDTAIFKHILSKTVTGNIVGDIKVIYAVLEE